MTEPRQTKEAPQAAQGKGGEDRMLPVFRKLRCRLRRMAAGLLGNGDEADDALQEAFCRLWPRRAGIRTEGEAEALLTTTVRNLSLNVLRQRKSRPALALKEDMDSPEDDGDEAAREAEERFREVERLIDTRLSPRQRQVLRLKEYRGLDFDTIARQLDMTPAAVRMALSRARKTIKECYNTYHHEN